MHSKDSKVIPAIRHILCRKYVLVTSVRMFSQLHAKVHIVLLNLDKAPRDSHRVTAGGCNIHHISRCKQGDNGSVTSQNLKLAKLSRSLDTLYLTFELYSLR